MTSAIAVTYAKNLLFMIPFPQLGILRELLPIPVVVHKPGAGHRHDRGHARIKA